MENWALVVDGKVRETTELDPKGRFHPSLEWIACGPEVEQEWLAVNDAFSAPQRPALADLKATTWKAIKNERERRKAGGVKVQSQWFHSDTDSRIQQIGLVMMAGAIPTGLQWKTMDGTFVEMTLALAQEVVAAVTANDMAIFSVAEAHRSAMEACTDPLAYDSSTGWPVMFGD